MKATLAAAAVALAAAGCVATSGNGPFSGPQAIPDARAEPPAATITFSFHAFGDAGWARSHGARPDGPGGFRQAYGQFDRDNALLGDLNYINWETSVGNRCDAFWAPLSASTYAFLTPPRELADAMQLGFNLIGLANNHAFDCLRSPEGHGPLQTVAHLQDLSQQSTNVNRPVLFSGVFRDLSAEARSQTFPLRSGTIPVRFLSAYVGGDRNHCRHILCASSLASLKPAMAGATGFRVLALHSWNAASHAKLKQILRSWLQEGLVDVAIGTGPHVAESVAVVPTPRGRGVLATSLGNFIHPGLSAQPNNIVLISGWSLNPASGELRLQALSTRRASCRGGQCRAGESRQLLP